MNVTIDTEDIIMKSTNSIIDFTELVSDVPGEGLEQLVRHIGEKKGLSPYWSGRGSDGGKDLLFTEIREGSLSTEKITWLVSCKDKAKSGDSVSTKDLPSTGIIDKLKQHKANAFLLVTTTTASTSAKEQLDSLDKSRGGEVNTLVWDSAYLRSVLLDSSNQDLLKQFLPESYKRYRGLTSLEGAILSFSSELPQEILDRVLQLIKPFSTSPLKGIQIWPHETNSAQIIDIIIDLIFVQEDFSSAVATAKDIEYDAFIALINVLYEDYVDECFNYLIKTAIEHVDLDVRFNAAQFLFDKYEIPPYMIIKIATHLDADALEQLYALKITQFVGQEIYHNTSSYQVQNAVNNFPGWTRIDDVHLSTLKVQPQNNNQISFLGELEVSIELTIDGDVIDSPTFYGEYEGFINERGMFLEKANVNTSHYLADTEDTENIEGIEGLEDMEFDDLPD